MSEDINLEVLDLPGVSPEIAKKMSDFGYEVVIAIAAASVGELKAILGIETNIALKMIEAARSRYPKHKF